MSDETPRPRPRPRKAEPARAGARSRSRQKTSRKSTRAPQARTQVASERTSRRGRSSTRGVKAPDARSRRRTLVAVVSLILVILLVAVPVYAAWQLLLVPEVDIAAGVPVQVEIPEGSGTAKIAEVLASAGVVENASMFRLRARIDGIDGKLRPGIYDLSTRMPYELVVEKLLAGPPIAYVTVTVPEGLRVDQVAVRIEEKVGIPAAEFEALANDASLFVAKHPYLAEAYDNSCEGYLFPKTYRVVEGSTATDVIELMLDQFDTELVEVDLAAAYARGLTLNQVVTLASMIEREAAVDEERPLVSSVIYNRLDLGMLLQIDATIEYVIRESKDNLLNSDLEIVSPYNTYKNVGLPPGPIASPGLASLQAAAQPADTDYLYYVLTSVNGNTHTFCETYDEFLAAKARYKSGK